MTGTYGQQCGFDRNMMSNADMQSGPRGKLRYNEPMSRHTSWRVGGPADRFYVPQDIEDLKKFLVQLPADEPITWIGLGSNLLVRDGGIRGTVIATKNVISDFELLTSAQIRVGSGIPCVHIARQSVRSELTGAEFMIGIPGTLGGALAMNAGAFGTETWDLVTQVITINRKGVEHTRTRADFSIGYRSVTGPADEWFVSALLQLQPDINNTGDNTISEFLSRRSQTQPVGEPSCGSVFRNPGPGIYAAQLIESCDLKGHSVGQAMISEKHANFIINQGNASAVDIEQLIKHVQQVVHDRYNINLVPEVRTLGEG